MSDIVSRIHVFGEPDEITRLRAELADARRVALDDARDIALDYANNVVQTHGHLAVDPCVAARQAAREIASAILALSERTP